jgi:hypothetical protein
MNTRILLSQSARLRYATGTMMYFAQGIPQGLLHIAMPAWLASQGVSAGLCGTWPVCGEHVVFHPFSSGCR